MDKTYIYDPENFKQDPAIAKSFLEAIEINSFNFLERDWRDYSEDESVDYAIYIFSEIIKDQDESKIYTSKGLSH